MIMVDFYGQAEHLVTPAYKRLKKYLGNLKVTYIFE